MYEPSVGLETVVEVALPRAETLHHQELVVLRRLQQVEVLGAGTPRRVGRTRVDHVAGHVNEDPDLVARDPLIGRAEVVAVEVRDTRGRGGVFGLARWIADASLGRRVHALAAGQRRRRNARTTPA